MALAPSSAEIICSLGAADQLVGIGRFVTHPPEIQHLPRVGGLHDPDLEKIASLKPTLMILRGASASLERMCRDQNIRIYHDRTDSLASVFETIDQLGKLLGASDNAKKLNNGLKQKLDAIKSESATTPRPRVLLTLRSPDRLATITTVAANAYLSELIYLAGGENIFGDSDVSYPQVRLEEIIARNPDIIIEVMPGASIDDDRRLQLLNQWSRLSAVEAVSKGHVFFVTESYATIPSPRVVLMAERLAQIIAPVQASP